MKDKTLLIAGAYGFLGKHLVEQLDKNNDVYIFKHSRCRANGADLTNIDSVNGLFENIVEKSRIDYVFHLAGRNGGLQTNLKEKADIFHDNTVMGLNFLNACHRFGVKKALSVVASCAYPANYQVLSEYDFLEDLPHESVEGHAYAKRNLQLASKFYAHQYGDNFVCVCPTTLYGPGDSFDPRKTKVLNALVKKFVDAVDNGEDKVIVWGSGKAKREFLYVEDCASLLIKTMERYENNTIPLNLGSGHELSIRELAELIAKKARFAGQIVFDNTKPDGEDRKLLDRARMKQVIGDFQFTPLEIGIERTIESYKQGKCGR